MVKLILDTDIGTDVDDCLALAFLLGSPEIEWTGITCVYGDVLLRARMVAKLLTLAGRPDIPIRLGASQTLLGIRSIYWEGHEGEGLLEASPSDPHIDPENAVDFIIRSVMDDPGGIHLLAIGPLTTVALALSIEPRLAQNMAGLTIMGGALRGRESLDLPIAEHNIACDPEAAQVVLASGAPITLVPLDVTTQCRIQREDVALLRARGDAFHAAVADQVERYPFFARHGYTYLHDPLAAAVMLRPDLVELTSVNVAVETEGRLTSGMTVMTLPKADSPAPVSVALQVDAAAAEGFIRERLRA